MQLWEVELNCLVNTYQRFTVSYVKKENGKQPRKSKEFFPTTTKKNNVDEILHNWIYGLSKQNPMEIKPINEDSTRQYLSVNKWPDSLQDILVKGCERFPVRYFVIDDSIASKV
jgi:hypothetical protein